MAQGQRPLSPHLQVYKPQITSVLSIFHRMTGVAMGGGMLLITWWLLAAAYGPEAYAVFHGFAASFLGQLIIAGFVWCLCYHLCNGIRHLIWDLGLGFDLESVTKSGILTLAASTVLTVAVVVLA